MAWEKYTNVKKVGISGNEMMTHSFSFLYIFPKFLYQENKIIVIKIFIIRTPNKTISTFKRRKRIYSQEKLIFETLFAIKDINWWLTEKQMSFKHMKICPLSEKHKLKLFWDSAFTHLFDKNFKSSLIHSVDKAAHIAGGSMKW